MSRKGSMYSIDFNWTIFTAVWVGDCCPLSAEIPLIKSILWNRNFHVNWVTLIKILRCSFIEMILLFFYWNNLGVVLFSVTSRVHIVLFHKHQTRHTLNIIAVVYNYVMLVQTNRKKIIYEKKNYWLFLLALHRPFKTY